MLDDIKPQPRPAAPATMFWICAFAAARITDAFAARGLALLRDMLAPVGRPLRSMAPDVASSPPPPGDGAQAADPLPSPEPTKAAAAPQAVPAFASYRSDGGHATAQVIFLPR
jgi:hypothetical protein